MNYYPNIERLNEINHLLKNDKNKSKLEYLIYTYITEHYKLGIQEDGLKRIVNNILKSNGSTKDIDLILISEVNQALQSNS